MCTPCKYTYKLCSTCVLRFPCLKLKIKNEASRTEELTMGVKATGTVEPHYSESQTPHYFKGHFARVQIAFSFNSHTLQ